MMEKYPIGIFWFAEINLILWLGAFGITVVSFFRDAGDSVVIKTSMGIAIAGVLLAACFQYWARRNIQKPAKQSKIK